MLRTSKVYTNLLQLSAIRSITTLQTPIHNLSNVETINSLTKSITLLDDILNSSSHNKTLLYKSKYKRTPESLSSQESTRLEHVVKNFLIDQQKNEITSSIKEQLSNPENRLSQLGLQFFLECNRGNLTPLSTTLSRYILEGIRKNPTTDTIKHIHLSIEMIRKFIKDNRVTNIKPKQIDILIKKLSNSQKDFDTIQQILKPIDYKIYSDTSIIFQKGKTREDSITISDGYQFPTGIIQGNEPYLRSIDIPKKKLLSFNDKPLLTLVYDGSLVDARYILPAINYATRESKSLLLIINGNCSGDAINAISIHNNKNKRQNIDSKVIVMKYDESSFNGISIQENSKLLEFLKLPKGIESIYSPTFSPTIPSKVSSRDYFGELKSMKCTVGEAILFNDIKLNHDCSKLDNFLKKTITVNLGGDSQFEINRRIESMDNLVNNFLLNGLKDGFVPSHGNFIIKSNSFVTTGENKRPKTFKNNLLFDALISALAIPSKNALINSQGLNSIQVAEMSMKTSVFDGFFNACLSHEDHALQDVRQLGILEPWNKMDETLYNVSTMIRLLYSCSTIISGIFEKPKKR
ncbi:hypothetical protein TBLA_0G03000 [Henningerozyma blattae CBS 6284]|uniref:Mitochondrial chaperone TCM62 n=1 Tax=Henningerozyma blattae (strain ATCC 34711 / CBS 6284 / DSM 70876 / NBRC 10599 / NRRL Y-10934 / UCD 77-7) TaxID=1071380 RepID=I2H785_HENB6|nr:hypothetical protein TBLA_0G03000 [Tetrapisispora blattae CBS 6284]CCH62237.1 hypothetical protein TBLA_0G03000 [Tetrapisispora blattae CBS 6284]